MIKGIDVSIIQGNIDWSALAASGIQFCIIRCGVGNSGIDSNYIKNVAGAQAAGLKVAAYNFLYPLPPQAGNPSRDPVAQAQMHAKAAGSVSVICCDLEWPTQPDWAKWGCSAAQIGEWTVAYLQAYQSLTGITPLVYTYPDFARQVNLPAAVGNYPLWIASYEPTPNIPKPWTDWAIWQTTGGGGKLPNGAPVDTDVARDLSLWQAAAPVAPAPVFVPPAMPVEIPAPVAPPPAPVAPAPAPTPSSNILSVIGQILNGITKYLK